VRVDEVSNCIGGHPGVVPQRPTKRLADEEFGIGCPLLNVRKQPGFVDCILVSKLVKDGGSSDPDRRPSGAHVRDLLQPADLTPDVRTIGAARTWEASEMENSAR